MSNLAEKSELSISCGIIPVRFKKGNVPEFLLVQDRKGHWTFPKGRPEKSDENDFNTAWRELLEETGLSIVCCDSGQDPLLQNYSFFCNEKRVKVYRELRFFVAEVDGFHTEVVLPERELLDYKWVEIDDILFDSSLHDGLRKNANEANERISNLL